MPRTRIKSKTKTKTPARPREHQPVLPPPVITEPTDVTDSGVIMVRDHLGRHLFTEPAWQLNHTAHSLIRRLADAHTHSDDLKSWWRITHCVHHHHRNWSHWYPYTTQHLELDYIQMPRATWREVMKVMRSLDSNGISQAIYEQSAEWISQAKIMGWWQDTWTTWSEAYQAWVIRNQSEAHLARKH